MYKKLIKAFTLKNFSLFFIIITTITLSLTGFLVSENLIKNVENLIAGEIRPIIGGDISIRMGQDENIKLLDYLQKEQIKGNIIFSKEISTLSTLESTSGDLELGSILFVDENFPLYGESESILVNKKGDIRVNEIAYNQFATQNGIIEVYGKKYWIKEVLKNNPNSLDVFQSGRPKVLLGINSFNNSGISGDNSLIERSIKIKISNPQDAENIFNNILSEIENKQKYTNIGISHYKNGGNGFEFLLKSLNNFIGYVLVISFLLTILIIFLSVESFFLKDKKIFSVLQILGLSTIKLIVFSLILFGLIFSISLGFSYSITELVFQYIQTYSITQNFQVYKTSLLEAGVVGIIILGVSVVLPLVKFLFNSPLEGLKQNFIQVYTKKELLLQSFLIVGGGVSILYLINKSIYLSILSVLSIFLIVSIVSYLLKKLLLILHGVGKKRIKNFLFYDAIRNTIKPGNLSIIIIYGFTIVASSFIFLSIIFLNFYDRLSLDLGNDKNIFVLNITKDGYEKLSDSLQLDTFSTLKGRILQINNQTLADHVGKEKSRNPERGGFDREYNITDSDLVEAKISKGEKVLNKGDISIDEKFAQRLDIQIGDTIQLSLYGKKQRFKVVNYRERNEGSINPFFYFQVRKQDFKNFPKTYFLATYVDSKNIPAFKKELVSKVGKNISFIEVDKILERVKSISRKVLTLIQILYLYISLFCVISIVSCIYFFKLFNDKKRKLYYIIGANRGYILKNNYLEYSYLQIIGVLLSLVTAGFSSYFLLERSNFISFSVDNLLISIGIIIAISLVLSGFIYMLLKKEA